jgi:hypothetical protein
MLSHSDPEYARFEPLKAGVGSGKELTGCRTRQPCVQIWISAASRLSNIATPTTRCQSLLDNIRSFTRAHQDAIITESRASRCMTHLCYRMHKIFTDLHSLTRCGTSHPRPTTPLRSSKPATTPMIHPPMVKMQDHIHTAATMHSIARP